MNVANRHIPYASVLLLEHHHKIKLQIPNYAEYTDPRYRARKGHFDPRQCVQIQH